MNANANTKKSGGGKKWLMLGGCGCLFVFVGCAGFVGMIFAGVRTMMINSESYALSREALSESQEAEDAVGAPFTPGWMMSGSVSTSNGRETSDYSYKVTGPNGTGTVYVRGECDRGRCDMQTLELDAKGQRIDLLSDEE